MTKDSPGGRTVEVADSRNVLVVDDDPVLRRLCAMALRNAGVRVLEVSAGEVALQRFGEQRVDLVLLDVQMSGMDGFETCRRLRAEVGGDAVPIIMLTGLDDAESIEKAYEAGATDFISKPFHWPLLTQRVRYALRAAAVAEESRFAATSLARAQRMAQLGNWSIAADGSMNCSAELARIFGVPEGQAHCATPEAFLERVVEADRARMMALRQELSTHNKGYEAVYAMQRFDGVVRTVYEQAAVIQDVRGKQLGLEGITQDITDRVEAERRIEKLTSHDALTGLPNRKHFQELLSTSLGQLRHDSRPGVLLQLDLDRFKSINDALGVAVGDSVLQAVTSRIRLFLDAAEVRRDGVVFSRVGPNAFCIFMETSGDAAVVGALVTKLSNAISEPLTLSGNELRITATVGVARFPVDAQDALSLMRYAEQALYVAKRDAVGSCIFYDPVITAEAGTQLIRESDLRRGIEADEMRVYLQPKVDVESGHVVGAEALIRWEHPERGIVPPGEFIPLAEKTGLIGLISEWMLEQVGRLAVGWREAGLKTVPISVNISASWFTSRRLLEQLSQLFDRTRIEPSSIVLEVTESLLVRDMDSCITRMHELRSMGVVLSLDDFGTGYSSLGYLKVMPLDELKLDRSFVVGVAGAGRDHALAAAIVSMAGLLELDVVAEGVEDEAQAAALRTMGCRIQQGYFHGRPAPAAQFSKHLVSSDSVERRQHA